MAQTGAMREKRKKRRECHSKNGHMARVNINGKSSGQSAGFVCGGWIVWIV